MAAIAYVLKDKNGVAYKGKLDQPGLSVAQLKRLLADQHGIRPRDVKAVTL